MRVFLTDATGYVGLEMAAACRRNGHQVYALVAGGASVSSLARNEVIPVTGDLQDPSSYGHVVATCDVVIHSACGEQGAAPVEDRSFVRRLLEAGRASSQPRALIYVSSVWVLGDSNGKRLTEEAPPSPPEIVAGLPEIEQMILTASTTRGLVIRPGVVYGRQGGYTGMWFKGASNGGVDTIVGDGLNHWAMVHVDDLARGCVLAAESDLGGEIFHLADATSYTVLEMVSAAARAAGDIGHLEFIPRALAASEVGAVAEALALDQMIDSSKAARMLGWQPKHRGFVPDVDTYYRAWRANRPASADRDGRRSASLAAV